jgi:hypothetical protein
MPGVSGLPVALMGSGVSAPANPNLLLWSEALDNAVWVKSGAVVTADAGLDPNGQMTAESVAFSAFGSLTQVTSMAATTASGSASRTPTPTLSRFNISGLIDGVAHIFSAYLSSAASSDVILSMSVVGGFAAVKIRDGGDAETFTVSWAKLETPALTAYVKRDGA